MSDPAQTFEVSDFVFTLDEEFAGRWFYNWPGVIRAPRSGGREFLVEFMGFGDVKSRSVVLPIGALKHLEDPIVGARLHRIAKQQTTPEAKNRGNLFKRVEPKISKELPEDDDEEFMH